MLVLDDQPADVELLCRELRRGGFVLEVQHVSDEQSFCAALEEMPDIILADYQLPQYDALRALAEIQFRCLDIPLIVVGSLISDEIAADCLKKGAADYVLKDHLAHLPRSVQNALNEKRLAISRRQVEQQSQRRICEHKLIAEFSASLRSNLDLESLLPQILRGLLLLIEADPLGPLPDSGVLSSSGFAALYLAPEHESPLDPSSAQALLHLPVDPLPEQPRLICRSVLIGMPLPLQASIPAALFDSITGPVVFSNSGQADCQASSSPAWIHNCLQSIVVPGPEDQDLPGGFTHILLPLFENTLGALIVPRTAAFDPPEFEHPEAATGSGSLAGLVYILLPYQRYLPGSELYFLNAAAGLAADAIQRSVFYQQAQLNRERMQALRSINIAISSSLDLRVTLSVLLDQAIVHLHADAVALLMLNPVTQTLQIAAARGFRSPARLHSQVRLQQDLSGQAIIERRLIFYSSSIAQSNNTGEGAFFLPVRSQFSAEGFRACGAIPLVAKGVIRGVMEVYFHQAFNPNNEWQAFLETLAGQAAIALDNATLFEELQRANTDLVTAYDVTIETWAHTFEYRNLIPAGHTRRLASLLVELARLLNWPSALIQQSRRGAILHDIGLLALPETILLKPGPFTEEERRLVQRHPALAYEMLTPIGYLKSALDIPYCHHEHWDGGGYPRGLKGERIPITARLFSLVDVWDALINDRPYRPAWSEEQARDYLRSESGKQFDPILSSFFLKHIGSLMKEI